MSWKDVLRGVAMMVAVSNSKTVERGVRVTFLGIPVYDEGWAGVQRRKARREARKAARRAS